MSGPTGKVGGNYVNSPIGATVATGAKNYQYDALLSTANCVITNVQFEPVSTIAPSSVTLNAASGVLTPSSVIDTQAKIKITIGGTEYETTPFRF